MRRFIAVCLSSLLLLQVTTLRAAPPAAGAVRSTIAGRAQTATAEQVQLRNLETGQLAGTTTTNAQGDFSFAGREPGRYAVELVNRAGAIVGASTAVAVPAGAVATVTVAAATAAMTRTSSSTGVAPATTSALAPSTATIVTTTARSAGIAGVVPNGRPHPSPSF